MIALALAIALSGTVTSTDGAPIPSAHVVVHAGARDLSATTDTSGAFAIDGVELPAEVDVSAAGFATIHRTVTASPAAFVLQPAAVAESVVVTPARDASWRDASSGATVLDRSDLNQIPALTADQALRVVSGFSLFRRSTSWTSNPTTHGVTMRGLSASGASRGLVLLDGIPLNDGFGGWITWSRLPPDAIAQIDVERGAAGDAFGSDALGGVIRIVSPRPQQPDFSVAAQGGSIGIAESDVSAGTKRGPISLFGAASGFRTDGTIPVAPESRGLVDRAQDVKWWNGFGRLDAAGHVGHLAIAGWGGRDDRGNGTVLQRNRMSGGAFSASFDTARRRTTLAARVSISPNSFYQTFTTVAASRALETLTSAQTTNTNAVRAVIESGWTVGASHLLATATFSHASADFTDARSAGSTTQALRDNVNGVAGQWTSAAGPRVTLSAGGRIEWRAAPTSSSSYESAKIGHAAATWQLADDLTVRGSIASSHRWPTLNELVRNFQAGNVLTQANPLLRPERSHSADGTLTFERRRWQISAGGFWTVIDDAVANVTISTGSLITRQRRNAGEAHAHGAEFDAEVRPIKTLRLRSSVMLTDATFRHSLEAPLEGKDLPQVPRVSASATADWTLPRAIVASFVWHAVSTQFDDDRNTFLLADAYQSDARIAGTIRRWGWQASVENLFDARIEVGRTPLVTIAPGRTGRVGFSFRW